MSEVNPFALFLSAEKEHLMIHSYEQFIEEAQSYLRLCEQFLAQYGLEDEVVVDHICYKCKSSAEYGRMRTLLETNPPSLYFYQVYLAKRRVAYLKLHNGLPIKGGTVNFIELADKKPAGEDVLGFHHAELYPVRKTYKWLLKKLQDQGVDLVLKERPHHTTHDIISGKFIIRLTDKPLIHKIIKDEMSH